MAYLSQLIAGFPGAHEVATELLPVKLTMNQLWQQALRVGRDLVARREAEAVEMLKGQPPAPSAAAPDLLVVTHDGGRFQDRDRPVGDRWCEYKAAVVYGVTRTEPARAGTQPDPQPEPHWQYEAGQEGFRRTEAGTKVYCDPKPEQKTMVATTETVERFPLLVELEGQRRGLQTAPTVVFVGDGGDFIWRTAREVGADRRAGKRETFEVLDLIHASEHLVEAAQAGPGVTAAGAAWLTARLRELWRGEGARLLAALAAEAAARRAQGRDDAAQVLARAHGYFTEHRERIRYDVFRRHGLPLTSAHIESGIKQTNRRVKGSEKQWHAENAEAMLALRCLALSEDGRWEKYFGALQAGQFKLPTPGRQARPARPERSHRSAPVAHRTASRSRKPAQPHRQKDHTP